METGTWVGAVIQSSISVVFSWVVANWCARTGYLNPSFDFVYHNWWLQGDGLVLNLVILFTIICGQLLRFSLWAASRYPLALTLGRGLPFLLAIAFTAITSVFMLSPEKEYPLWFNTPFDFSLAWVFIASVTFAGAGFVQSKRSLDT